MIDTRSKPVCCPPAVVPLTEMFPPLPALTHLAVACSAAYHTENQLLVTVTSEPAGVSITIWQSPSANNHVSFIRFKVLLVVWSLLIATKEYIRDRRVSGSDTVRRAKGSLDLPNLSTTDPFLNSSRMYPQERGVALMGSVQVARGSGFPRIETVRRLSPPIPLH